MTTPPPRLGRVVIAGGAGFLGRSLTRELAPLADDVVILTRGGSAAPQGNVRHVNWDARTVGPWARELDGAAALVNYVGRTVDCRKTPANKRVILESRVDSVRALGAAIAACAAPPPVWVQSATAHIYGDTGDEVLDESSPVGAGFAPDVGTAWERALATRRGRGAGRWSCASASCSAGAAARCGRWRGSRASAWAARPARGGST